MAKRIIRTGTTADPTGDSLKNAFTKVNDNFTELYNALGLDADTLNLGAFEFSGSIDGVATITTTDSSAIVIDQATTVTSNLSVGGDILPSTHLGGNLGSPTQQWKSLYVSTNTIYLNNVPLALDSSNNLLVNNAPISTAINYASIPNAPTDVADLTDTGNLLGGGGLTGWTVTTGNHIVPNTDNLQDIGTPENRVRHVYVGPGSVYIGNNVITESATGGLVLPGVTRATGYYADEVEDEDRWGSNPAITGTVTVIDATRYRILAGQITASANYSPATYTVQKDGNRIDEINVSSGGGGWTKAEADYARNNNMYATNVAGDINNFNAGNWQQIPFRVEIKAEDTEYEDIFGGGTELPSQEGHSGKFLTTDGEDLSWADAPGGGADLGEIVIYDSAITTDGESSIYIAPNGEGYGYVIVPNDTSAVSGAATVIGNSRNDGGGVQIAAYNNTWTFGPDGDLTLPAGGDIVNSSGQSVLGGGATSYTPEDSDLWDSPTVNTVAAALDELAAKVAALQNFEIDGGNANTPAAGELLIDGNGA